MHEVDEHGVGGEHADGFIDIRIAMPSLQPVEREAEEKNRADGVGQSLRAQLVIGVRKVEQAVAPAVYGVIAAVHVPADARKIDSSHACRKFSQQCKKFLPVHRRQAAAYKNKQIMQGQVV